MISTNSQDTQQSGLHTGGLPTDLHSVGTVTSASSFKKMVTTERISKMMSSQDLSKGFEILGRKFSPEEVVTLSIAAGMEKKASRPVALDLNRLGAFANYFAILSASNGRQVCAVAEGIRLFIKQAFGISPIMVDGLESQQWVFLDYGFLFVHVFQEATREMYSLEQLWSKGQLIDFTEQSASALLSEVKDLQAKVAEQRKITLAEIEAKRLSELEEA